MRVTYEQVEGAIDPSQVEDWHKPLALRWADTAPRTSQVVEHPRQMRLCSVDSFHTHTCLPGSVWGGMLLECSGLGQ